MCINQKSHNPKNSSIVIFPSPTSLKVTFPSKIPRFRLFSLFLRGNIVISNSEPMYLSGIGTRIRLLSGLQSVLTIFIIYINLAKITHFPKPTKILPKNHPEKILTFLICRHCAEAAQLAAGFLYVYVSAVVPSQPNIPLSHVRVRGNPYSLYVYS